MGAKNPKAKRQIYPLDITELSLVIAQARKKTGIRSQAQLMRLAISRGLPILVAQLKNGEAA